MGDAAVIRLLLLNLRRRWLVSAIENTRHTASLAADSEQVFVAELRRVDAAIAVARLDQRYRVAR